jgi:hypothetical protein
MVKAPWVTSVALFYPLEEVKMIDKREGETKKPQPTEPAIFPQSQKDKCPTGDVQPSQKKAPKQVYGE